MNDCVKKKSNKAFNAIISNKNTTIVTVIKEPFFRSKLKSPNKILIEYLNDDKTIDQICDWVLTEEYTKEKNYKLISQLIIRIFKEAPDKILASFATNQRLISRLQQFSKFEKKYFLIGFGHFQQIIELLALATRGAFLQNFKDFPYTLMTCIDIVSIRYLFISLATNYTQSFGFSKDVVLKMLQSMNDSNKNQIIFLFSKLSKEKTTYFAFDHSKVIYTLFELVISPSQSEFVITQALQIIEYVKKSTIIKEKIEIIMKYFEPKIDFDNLPINFSTSIILKLFNNKFVPSLILLMINNPTHMFLHEGIMASIKSASDEVLIDFVEKNNVSVKLIWAMNVAKSNGFLTKFAVILNEKRHLSPCLQTPEWNKFVSNVLNKRLLILSGQFSSQFVNDEINQTNSGHKKSQKKASSSQSKKSQQQQANDKNKNKIEDKSDIVKNDEKTDLIKKESKKKKEKIKTDEQKEGKEDNQDKSKKEKNQNENENNKSKNKSKNKNRNRNEVIFSNKENAERMANNIENTNENSNKEDSKEDICPQSDQNNDKNEAPIPQDDLNQTKADEKYGHESNDTTSNDNNNTNNSNETISEIKEDSVTETTNNNSLPKILDSVLIKNLIMKRMNQNENEQSNQTDSNNNSGKKENVSHICDSDQHSHNSDNESDQINDNKSENNIKGNPNNAEDSKEISKRDKENLNTSNLMKGEIKSPSKNDKKSKLDIDGNTDASKNNVSKIKNEQLTKTPVKQSQSPFNFEPSTRSNDHCRIALIKRKLHRNNEQSPQPKSPKEEKSKERSYSVNWSPSSIQPNINSKSDDSNANENMIRYKKRRFKNARRNYSDLNDSYDELSNSEIHKINFSNDDNHDDGHIDNKNKKIIDLGDDFSSSSDEENTSINNINNNLMIGPSSSSHIVHSIFGPVYYSNDRIDENDSSSDSSDNEFEFKFGPNPQRFMRKSSFNYRGTFGSTYDEMFGYN